MKVSDNGKLECHDTEIPEVKVLIPKRMGDNRGWFVEAWNGEAMASVGLDIPWVQDNHSMSATPGTLRGLHYQAPPVAQDKLVRVLAGRIWDVAVDVRHGSPSFLKHVAVELSADNGKQLLVPRGFAHGFVTLEADTQVFYKVSAPYDPDCDEGFAWNDPQVAVPWPLDGTEPVLSGKDKTLPPFADLPERFSYR